MLLWLGVAFMVVGLIVIWVLAIIDMFKRKDLRPWQIGLWIAAVVLFPIARRDRLHALPPPGRQRAVPRRANTVGPCRRSVPERLLQHHAREQFAALRREVDSVVVTRQ